MRTELTLCLLKCVLRKQKESNKADVLALYQD